MIGKESCKFDPEGNVRAEVAETLRRFVEHVAR